jgi:hypothetical protein
VRQRTTASAPGKKRRPARTRRARKRHNFRRLPAPSSAANSDTCVWEQPVSSRHIITGACARVLAGGLQNRSARSGPQGGRGRRHYHGARPDARIRSRARAFRADRARSRPPARPTYWRLERGSRQEHDQAAQPVAEDIYPFRLGSVALRCNDLRAQPPGNIMKRLFSPYPCPRGLKNASPQNHLKSCPSLVEYGVST